MVSALSFAQTLVIGLYDYSDLSDKEIMGLTKTAGLALGHAGIHIVWLHCRGALAVEPRNTCEAEMEVNEIIVRLWPVGRGSTDDRTLHLGHAIVTAKGGHYATVFVPAVRAQAAEFGMAFDLLIGYAVAHEAGHCLLGPSHSNSGLMRGAWTHKDALEISRLSLHLSRPEARKAVAWLTPAEPNARE